MLITNLEINYKKKYRVNIISHYIIYTNKIIRLLLYLYSMICKKNITKIKNIEKIIFLIMNLYKILIFFNKNFLIKKLLAILLLIYFVYLCTSHSFCY